MQGQCFCELEVRVRFHQPVYWQTEYNAAHFIYQLISRFYFLSVDFDCIQLFDLKSIIIHNVPIELSPGRFITYHYRIQIIIALTCSMTLAAR